MGHLGPGYDGVQCPGTAWKGSDAAHLASLREGARCKHPNDHKGLCHTKSTGQAFNLETGDVVLVSKAA